MWPLQPLQRKEMKKESKAPSSKASSEQKRCGPSAKDSLLPWANISRCLGVGLSIFIGVPILHTASGQRDLHTQDFCQLHLFLSKMNLKELRTASCQKNRNLEKCLLKLLGMWTDQSGSKALCFFPQIIFLPNKFPEVLHSSGKHLHLCSSGQERVAGQHESKSPPLTQMWNESLQSLWPGLRNPKENQEISSNKTIFIS